MLPSLQLISREQDNSYFDKFYGERRKEKVIEKS